MPPSLCWQLAVVAKGHASVHSTAAAWGLWCWYLWPMLSQQVIGELNSIALAPETWYHPSPAASKRELSHKPRTCPSGLGMEELARLLMALRELSPHPPIAPLRVVISGGQDWPTLLPPRPISKALKWSTPMSTPSKTYDSIWRDWPFWAIAADLHACGNSRISENSFGEGSILMVHQKPKTSNQTNISLQWTLESKAVWAKDCTAWHTAAVKVTKTKWIIDREAGKTKEQSVFIVLLLLLILFEWKLQGWKVDMKKLGIKLNWGAWVEITIWSLKKLWQNFNFPSSLRPNSTFYMYSILYVSHF